MFTKAELIDAINELEEGKHSIQNCSKLAAIYTVLDHLYPPEEPLIEKGYSGDQAQKADAIVLYGDTEFLNAIAGRDSEEIWLLIDELMTTLSVINPRLYDAVMRKIMYE